MKALVKLCNKTVFFFVFVMLSLHPLNCDWQPGCPSCYVIHPQVQLTFSKKHFRGVIEALYIYKYIICKSYASHFQSSCADQLKFSFRSGTVQLLEIARHNGTLTKSFAVHNSNVTAQRVGKRVNWIFFNTTLNKPELEENNGAHLRENSTCTTNQHIW